MLKPQDILVALKLVALGNERWTYASLAESLGLSISETHSAVKRGLESRLLTRYNPAFEKVEKPLPNLTNLENLLVNSLQFLMPVPKGGGKVCQGMPTADGAHPLANEITIVSERGVPVWPTRKGQVRGVALTPLHPLCPSAAARDERLYELLTLADGLRFPATRTRNIAQRLLHERFAAIYEARKAAHA